MTESDEELNKFGKRVFSALRPADPLDPSTAAEEKAKFLAQVENMRSEGLPVITGEPQKKAGRLAGIFHRKQPLPLFKVLIAVMVVVILLVGSSATVFAAQNSLPGDPLYTIKSFSEDVRLTMALTPQTKLDLTLTYTNRRAGEISNLVSNGASLPAQTSERYQQELEHALELAAQLNDQQMQTALIQIKNMAENQGMTIEELLAKLPEQATPAIIRLQERLQEQVMLSSFGESDPQAFRNEMKARQQIRQEMKHSSEPEQTEEFPMIGGNTPMPEQNDTSTEMTQPTQVPGHKGPDNGQDQNMPGNGNHGQGANHTPKP
jgi:hypothetical protein